MSNIKDHVETVVDGAGKRVALLIALLALALAFVDAGGKGAQQNALVANVEASNLWAFFQAKTIRRQMVSTEAEAMETSLAGVADPALRAAMERRVAAWRVEAARFDSEPATNEGRRELMVRARAAEAARDLAARRADWYDYSAGVLQVAIVIASASIITAMPVLATLGGVMGVAGVALGAIGYFAPNIL
jgi:hypothetical protein